MVKKILKFMVIVTIVILILMLSLAIKPKKSEVANNTTENKTIEEQVIEVLSIDETDNNIIGYITIKELGIENAPIAEGTDNKTIGKYVGHFENSSYLEGNVALCSHNRGSNAAYFENLKNAVNGMKIEYKTKYETKTYVINEIKVIDETDFSVLNPTEENRITLITCVENQHEKRLCVIGRGE